MSSWAATLRWAPLFLLAASASVSVSVAGIATGMVLVQALFQGWLDRPRTAWPPRSVTLSLCALVAVYCLATLLAAPFPSNWNKLGEEMWIKLLLVAVPVAIGADRQRAVLLVQVAVVVGVLAAVYSVWQHFSEFDPIRQRSLFRPQFGHIAVSGFFSHHLSYGGQALIFLMLSLAWLLGSAFARCRLWLVVAAGALAAALLWCFARSAQLGAVAGFLVLVALLPGRRRWIGAGALVAGLGAALLLAPVRAHLLMLLEMNRHVTRLNLWESSLHGIAARPLLGFGPGNFQHLLEHHQIEGYYETLAHSHQDLLMHGVNAGVPAILAALALLVATCLVFWSGWRRQVSGAWVLLGAVAVQVGITVAGFFQVYQTDDEVEILLYFVLGCALAVAGQAQAEAGPEKPGFENIV